MGLVAKEEVVGVFGVLDFKGLAPLAGYAFLAFNLLCAPCFAAIGAIKREMNSAKWTLFAVGYQCVFAYAVGLAVFQIGKAFAGGMNIAGLAVALVIVGAMCWQLFKPYREANTLTIQ
jgi:ferrous iron transport protein B